jgi:hypothetical protein
VASKGVDFSLEAFVFQHFERSDFKERGISFSMNVVAGKSCLGKRISRCGLWFLPMIIGLGRDSSV